MPYNRNEPYNDLPDLPPATEIESAEILKLSIQANRLLAELKGYCQTLPNPNLLLNTIVLQESKASNAIENIVTTQDELYRATLEIGDSIRHSAAKEVIQYRQAMYWGLGKMREQGFITGNLLIGIMQQLRNAQSGLRTAPGTKLANPYTQEIVYTPPFGPDIIQNKLTNLEKFINIDDHSELDPLVKMALIHYQFEAIHPFSDGNGRTGRILNVLYLIQQKLIVLPILYLSYYIIQNKQEYYRLLKEVTEEGNWKQWVAFILRGVSETADMTLKKINRILETKLQVEHDMKSALGSSYTREINDLIFSYPYIKIRVLEQYRIARRQTASVYLQKLAQKGILTPAKIGKETYYINHRLMEILAG